ncbi:hypothetical protein B0H10DRAFT_2186246 [Mycena sp. CBHHK59/15]|nr:hypothetical protein B0H10DRAFT_2186246 [Mycena sp. CBHHK59/15]
MCVILVACERETNSVSWTEESSCKDYKCQEAQEFLLHAAQDGKGWRGCMQLNLHGQGIHAQGSSLVCQSADFSSQVAIWGKLAHEAMIVLFRSSLVGDNSSKPGFSVWKRSGSTLGGVTCPVIAAHNVALCIRDRRTVDGSARGEQPAVFAAWEADGCATQEARAWSASSHLCRSAASDVEERVLVWEAAALNMGLTSTLRDLDAMADSKINQRRNREFVRDQVFSTIFGVNTDSIAKDNRKNLDVLKCRKDTGTEEDNYTKGHPREEGEKADLRSMSVEAEEGIGKGEKERVKTQESTEEEGVGPSGGKTKYEATELYGRRTDRQTISIWRLGDNSIEKPQLQAETLRPKIESMKKPWFLRPELLRWVLPDLEVGWRLAHFLRAAWLSPAVPPMSALYTTYGLPQPGHEAPTSVRQLAVFHLYPGATGATGLHGTKRDEAHITQGTISEITINIFTWFKHRRGTTHYSEVTWAAGVHNPGSRTAPCKLGQTNGGSGLRVPSRGSGRLSAGR